MTLEGTLPEAMDTQSKPNTVDARLPEALNTGPNAVAMVTSLRDAAAMGAKEMSVDESHHSEALGPLQEPAPTVRNYILIIDLTSDHSLSYVCSRLNIYHM